MIGKKRILEYSEILAAQSISKSEAETARWLGVRLDKYVRYAKQYGLYGRRLNRAGKGIKKHPNREESGKYPLSAIIKENKFPDYSNQLLKKRCMRSKTLPEQCDMCGLSEKRVHDNKMPLILAYRDGNKKNKLLENLQLVCYNCYFYNIDNPKGNKLNIKYDDV
jgi:hypothetical protein